MADRRRTLQRSERTAQRPDRISQQSVEWRKSRRGQMESGSTAGTERQRRSDEIRQRRQSRSHHADAGSRNRSKRIRKAGVTLGVPAPPPVVTRYAMPGLVQTKSRRGETTRRRLDVPLNSQGAEMRLPALPQVRIGWRLISFILVISLSFTLYQLWSSPTYRIESVEISGLKTLSAQELNQSVAAIGEQVIRLSTEEIEQKIIQDFPEILAASVEIGLPNSMAITVTERLPVLIWKQDGRLDFVDVQGYAYPVRHEELVGGFLTVEASGSPPAISLPAAKGSAETEETPPPGVSASLFPELQPERKARQLLTKAMVDAILLLAKQAPPAMPLVYHSEHGLGWVDNRGWIVYFGDAQDVEEKLIVYVAIVQRLAESNITPAMISVEYVHAPYYRLER